MYIIHFTVEPTGYNKAICCAGNNSIRTWNTCIDTIVLIKSYKQFEILILILPKLRQIKKKYLCKHRHVMLI